MKFKPELKIMNLTTNFLNSRINWEELSHYFLDNQPFPHVIIDNFFENSVASAISNEFPSYEDSAWRNYNNAIENKKLLNHWDKFPKTIYQVMVYLNSSEFTTYLEKLTNIKDILVDPGLNGGGLHIHKRGGKLNVHLDYSVHPKLHKERRLNLLVYLTPDWNFEWGGDLELYSHDPEKHKPKQKIISIPCLFNRAIIFDTTVSSWHGLPTPLNCPNEVTRKSLAVYYLTEPREKISSRGKALFAPTQEQIHDPSVLDLIKKRSQVETADSVYE